jgi:hypothetical protein
VKGPILKHAQGPAIQLRGILQSVLAIHGAGQLGKCGCPIDTSRICLLHNCQGFPIQAFGLKEVAPLTVDRRHANEKACAVVARRIDLGCDLQRLPVVLFGCR